MTKPPTLQSLFGSLGLISLAACDPRLIVGDNAHPGSAGAPGSAAGVGGDLGSTGGAAGQPTPPASAGNGGSTPAPTTGGSGGTGPIAAPPPVPTDGLIGAWNFDEGAGTAVKDSSPAKNDGTAVKGTTSTAGANPSATWVDGRRGKALHFNGTDEWVNVPRSTSLDSTGDTGMVTLAGWVKVTGFASGDKPWTWVASRQEQGTSYEHFGLGLLAGAPACSIHFSFAIAPQSVPLDQWVHLAMTYDALTCTVYEAGQKVTSLDVGWPISADVTQFVMGGNQNLDAVKELLDGVVDEVRLYNRALTQEEIAALAQ